MSASKLARGLTSRPPTAVAATSSCCTYLISLGPVEEVFSPGNFFQFRVIQREHAGSSCNCWRLLDVSLQRQNRVEFTP